MGSEQHAEHIDTVVIGAGQAGLSVGHHLQRRGVPFVILDANARIGDVWRQRWDSLRLFTPAKFGGLDGLPFPAAPNYFPTKDEFADYLEAYARHFALPLRLGVRVDRVSPHGDGFLIVAGPLRIVARSVVVAMANYQRPRRPAFAGEIAAPIRQLHSSEYRGPEQLQPGDVLVVGAGNSGAEIALEAARHGHRTWLAGRDTGHVPFQIDGLAGRLLLMRLVLRVAFHRVLTVATPIGRKVRQKVRHVGGALVRLKPRDLARAGVERVGRVTGAREGQPTLADGRVVAPATIVWCTGFHPGFSWIDVPVFDPDGEPRHDGGLVPEQPGLFFVGLHFLYAFSSTMIHGVGRDAARIADAVADRRRQNPDAADPASAHARAS
jgi:putative flavoprotein involved in K+ transport